MDERNKIMKHKFLYLLLVCIFVLSAAEAQKKKNTKTVKTQKQSAAVVKDSISAAEKPMITFVELGSVNCIPCKAMQKVMKAVEEKYGSQIKIVFYDVWTQEQAPYAQKYNIRLIPTQVFLDAKGVEIMRHEGFFPEKDIDEFLQSKGLKALK